MIGVDKITYIEEWKILNVCYDEVSNETLVDFAFYFPNGEFDENDVCAFPKEDLEKWKSKIGKRIKVQCRFDENGDRIIEKII